MSEVGVVRNRRSRVEVEALVAELCCVFRGSAVGGQTDAVGQADVLSLPEPDLEGSRSISCSSHFEQQALSLSVAQTGQSVVALLYTSGGWFGSNKRRKLRQIYPNVKYLNY
jgi:hypothetical protein